jgi:hypothetical protein
MTALHERRIVQLQQLPHIPLIDARQAAAFGQSTL